MNIGEYKEIILVCPEKVGCEWPQYYTVLFAPENVNIDPIPDFMGIYDSWLTNWEKPYPRNAILTLDKDKIVLYANEAFPKNIPIFLDLEQGIA